MDGISRQRYQRNPTTAAGNKLQSHNKQQHTTFIKPAGPQAQAESATQHSWLPLHILRPDGVPKSGDSRKGLGEVLKIPKEQLKALCNS